MRHLCRRSRRVPPRPRCPGRDDHRRRPRWPGHLPDIARPRRTMTDPEAELAAAWTSSALTAWSRCTATGTAAEHATARQARAMGSSASWYAAQFSLIEAPPGAGAGLGLVTIASAWLMPMTLNAPTLRRSRHEPDPMISAMAVRGISDLILVHGHRAQHAAAGRRLNSARTRRCDGGSAQGHRVPATTSHGVRGPARHPGRGHRIARTCRVPGQRSGRPRPCQRPSWSRLAALQGRARPRQPGRRPPGAGWPRPPPPGGRRHEPWTAGVRPGPPARPVLLYDGRTGVVCAAAAPPAAAAKNRGTSCRLRRFDQRGVRPGRQPRRQAPGQHHRRGSGQRLFVLDAKPREVLRADPGTSLVERGGGAALSVDDGEGAPGLTADPGEGAGTRSSPSAASIPGPGDPAGQFATSIHLEGVQRSPLPPGGRAPRLAGSPRPSPRPAPDG